VFTIWSSHRDEVVSRESNRECYSANTPIHLSFADDQSGLKRLSSQYPGCAVRPIRPKMGITPTCESCSAVVIK
jgi:hypothetical protein